MGASWGSNSIYLDLSVLGVPNTDSRKPHGQPKSPASVNPHLILFHVELQHRFVLRLDLPILNKTSFRMHSLALTKYSWLWLRDQSRGADIKAQATICAQYKIAVTLLQDEMARLSRHLASLPLLAKHRINCIRTAIKRNMEVQNYGDSKQMLELLLSKAPASKQEELRELVDFCVQRGTSNKSIDPLEDPSHLCSAGYRPLAITPVKLLTRKNSDQTYYSKIWSRPTVSMSEPVLSSALESNCLDFGDANKNKALASI
ncbi:hypothetical protein HID58_042461 [Brassica napus]|uniref:Uncharacterized protein n=1 Tax=Brassica napus TaxID=3708 RepID=A0ABQ8BE40_BRANA|nr:hypothetical protein HID58_042461 [Brassica napus]